MDKLSERAQRAIDEKVFPGCVIGMVVHGKHEIRPYGEAFPMYDLASITKSIPLAALAALFVSEGKLKLSNTVKTFVPELQNDFDATIEDMLRYRVRGVRMASLQEMTHDEIHAAVMRKGFTAPPDASVYTNLPAFILGVMLERVGGVSLDRLAQEHFFGPYGMSTTTFFPEKAMCAPTEIVGGETVQGVPHDESTRVFAHAGRTVGHAGLFSTAQDLLRFAQRLIDEPHHPIVHAAKAGLGWDVNTQNFMGVHAHPKMFGKTGFTGTSIIVDVETRSALVILSNRTYPQRPADDMAINAFRRDIADIIYGSWMI